MPIAIGTDAGSQASTFGVPHNQQIQYGQRAARNYADTTSGKIRQQVNDLLSKVPHSGGKLSFNDVFAYRDELKEQLEKQVSADLEKLGVDLSKDLQLAMNGAGEVVAGAGHPDKDLVDRYFLAHPEMVEKYATALKINQLAGVAEQRLPTAAYRQELQKSAMEMWFNDNAGENIFTGSLASILNRQGLGPLAGVQAAV